MQQPFAPFAGVANTVNAAVTGTTAALALTASSSVSCSVRIANIGTQTIFIALGDSTVTAVVATSMPVLANTVEVFDKGAATHVAHIAGTTGSTLYATTGMGV